MSNKSAAHLAIASLACLVENVDKAALDSSTLRDLAALTVGLARDVIRDVENRIEGATHDERVALADVALSAKSTAKLAVVMADDLRRNTGFSSAHGIYNDALSAVAAAERVSQKARD